MGYDYGIQQNAPPAPVPQACRSTFGTWCLDKSSLSKGVVIGIIAVGSAAIVAGIAFAVWLAVRRRMPRKVQPQPHYEVRGMPCQLASRIRAFSSQSSLFPFPCPA